MGKIRILAAFAAWGAASPASHPQSFLPQPKPVPPITERPSAPSPAPAPRLLPVAENRMLMVGLCQPNFRGLGKRLADKPADADTWTIVRGQALIVAETGNLLMLRPPKGNTAQEAWMKAAAELRSEAARLARAAESQDYPEAVKGLAALANACNRCHEHSGEKARVSPFEAR
jgi:hypothetical protein